MDIFLNDKIVGKLSVNPTLAGGKGTKICGRTYAFLHPLLNHFTLNMTLIKIKIILTQKNLSFLLADNQKK
jgi:hypothetical protein